MIRSYKYRIYLNKTQTSEIENQFYFCRFLYNCALEEKISSYKAYKKSISYEDQSKQLPEIKALFKEESSGIYAQVLQSTLKRVDVSLQNFFRRVKNKSDKAGLDRKSVV